MKKTQSGKILNPFHWPKLRHPIHYFCGALSGACVADPNTARGIATMFGIVAVFGLYEKWEDDYLKDEGWRDWWEFIVAYGGAILVVLILSFKGII